MSRVHAPRLWNKPLIHKHAQRRTLDNASYFYLLLKMAYLWIWIVVLTSLQLCGAEISDTQKESWYSANVINEEFHPKPISEIFSTEASFSQGNPIIVLPKSSVIPNDITFWSTYASPLHSLPSAEALSSKTIPQSTLSTILSSSEETDTMSSTESSSQLSKSNLAVSMQTEPEQTTVEQPIEPFIKEIQSTEQPNSEEINKSSNSLNPQTTPTVALSSSAVTSHEMSLSTQSVPIQPQTSSEVPSQSQSSAQAFSETTILPQFSSSIADSSNAPSTTLPSTILPETFSNTPFSSSAYPISSSSFASYNPSSISDLLLSTPKPSFPLRIRVFAPFGSITNVKINPTTTTKKPTIIRTRKPKNLYKVCINSCEGSKTQICAAPLTKGLIDPSTLKGFPSICHMACYNTFKEERYEKLIDGRCGKLRTRIRPVDSKNKLKRTELSKTEYTIENSDSHTVVEFADLG